MYCSSFVMPSHSSAARAQPTSQSSAPRKSVLSGLTVKSRPRVLGRGYALALIPPALYLTVFFLWPLLRVVLRSVLICLHVLGTYSHRG